MQLLKPRVKPILVNGNLYYCEGDRSNSIIRLRKEIRQEFLEDMRKSVKYQMEYYRTKEEFQSRVKKLVDAGSLPFLLFLYEGEKE